MTEPNNQQPAIRVVMMPRDTNPMGTIFGGLIGHLFDRASEERRFLEPASGQRRGAGELLLSPTKKRSFARGL